MASPERLQYVKAVKRMLGDLPEEDSGLITNIALDYGEQLRQAQIPLDQYIPNVPDFVKELKGSGMSDGQVTKYMEKTNIASIQDAMQQRDAQVLAEEDAKRQHMMQQAAIGSFNESLGGPV